MRDGRVLVSNHVQQMSANGVNTIVAGNPTVFVEGRSGRPKFLSEVISTIPKICA